MNLAIYDKADRGREEIATRKYQLAPRLRSLLVMIDGKQTKDDLLKKVLGLGLNEQSLQDLLDQEFIVLRQNVQATPNRQAIPVIAAIAANAPAVEITRELFQPSTPEDAAARFQSLYNFYNETIKSTLGLRGYALQLKVERAGNLDDFQQLRHPYIEAVLKAKGQEMARSLRDRLDQLLYADIAGTERVSENA
jgi:hypothetical protein